MGLLRQACVQGSYGMAPLCCAEAPLPAFSLVNNHTSPFFFFVLSSPKAREGNIHAASEADLPPKHGV